MHLNNEVLHRLSPGLSLWKNPCFRRVWFPETTQHLPSEFQLSQSSADALQIVSHSLQNLATNIPTFALIFLGESDSNASFKLHMKGDVWGSAGHSYTISFHLFPWKSIPVLVWCWRCTAQNQGQHQGSATVSNLKSSCRGTAASNKHCTAITSELRCWEK